MRPAANARLIEVDLRNLLTLTALLIGAVASGVLLFRSGPEEPADEQGPRLGIGYFMTDARLVGTGEDGRALYRVSAANASQNLADGAVEMEEVRMIYDPLADIPWDVRADAGRMPPDGNIIELEGNVVATTREGDRAPTTIRTDYLEMDPETFVAQTSRKVTVEYEGRNVYATGMRLYLRDDRLQLISNVNGKFVP